MSATWWDNPGSQKGDVVAHTPDPTRYHAIGYDQASHMRPGLSGVIIPRARDDGTSMGFDATVPGVVHVDPNAPDGGAIVDLSRANAQSLRAAYAGAQAPHEVFYQLANREQPSLIKKSASVAPTADTPLPSNPHMPPGTYVVPPQSHQFQKDAIVQPVPATSGPSQPFHPSYPAPVPYQPAPVQTASTQQPNVTAATPPQTTAPTQYPQAPVAPQWQPQPGYQPVYPQYQNGYYPPAPVPPQTDPAVMQALDRLTNAMAGFMESHKSPVPPLDGPIEGARELARASQQHNRSARVGDMPAMAPVPPQTTHDVERSKMRLDNKVVVGFETLGIPSITGPLPNVPRQKVFFELPGYGTSSAPYHEVVESGNAVVLMYDTRFTEGIEYLPPALGSSPEAVIKVGVPHLKKEFYVNSFGLHYNVGSLLFVVLVKASGHETITYEENNE
jgi:hypothetical protein